MTIPKDSPIDHARRRASLVDKCAAWLKSNGLAESRAVYLANFIEHNVERWAADLSRPAV